MRLSATCAHAFPVRRVDFLTAAAFATLFVGILAAPMTAQDRKKDIPENPFPNRIKAPSLSGGTAWLNTSGEISLADLRGKVVLLDFWTYCCINCHHVLPDLKHLEEKYAKEIVVIGVHSAKFDNEKDDDNIRQAIVRYGIEHPVVNDSEMAIWRKFFVRAWPTLLLIDPEGFVCGSISGEGHRELLENVIDRVVAHHKAKGTLDTTPIQFDLEQEKLPPMPLKYPGKVLADERGDRLFISDSSHNRIIVTRLNGELLDIIGTGAMGAENGGYDRASFDHPQGMELVDGTLYVADVENHMIRRVDLQAKRVATLAGNGKQARFRSSGGRLRSSLNSPWAIRHHDDTLFIAMAGPHQIWSHRLGSSSIGVYAGSGREDITDGDLKSAAMAQPSGITSDDKWLYVVDSEGSAVRKIATNPAGKMTTVVGPRNLPQGRSLFEFADIDGVGAEARLQHPLGIVHHDGVLYVADSYNHKIKRVDLATQESQTFLGTGEAGDSLKPPRFSEPGGVAVGGGKLFIADTNNHRICVADLATSTVTVLDIAGLEPPNAEDAVTSPFPKVAATTVKGQTIKAGQPASLKIAFTLPAGYKLNQEVPVVYQVKAIGNQSVIDEAALEKIQKTEGKDGGATIVLPIKGKGPAKIEVTLNYGYCRDGVGGLCKLGTARWIIPLTSLESANSSEVPLKATAAELPTFPLDVGDEEKRDK